MICMGRESLLFGEINVWHFTRYLKSTGIFNDGYGTPRVEHGRRVLLATEYVTQMKKLITEERTRLEQLKESMYGVC